MKNRLVLLPAIALILGGCSVAQNATKQIQQKVEEKTAEQAIIANCKFDKDACAYMATAATMMTKPLIMTTSADVKGSGKEESKTVMDGKGNMQMTNLSNGKEESAMILLDGDTYTKQANETVWTLFKADKNSSESTTGFDPKKLVDEFKANFEEENEDDFVMTKVGQEACGTMAPGLTCFKYETYLSSSPNDKTFVWFDTDKHLARKMESNLIGTTSTITYAYDNVPVVTKPSPVKEFSMPSLPPEAKQQMPSQEDIQKMMQQFGDGAAQQSPSDGE